jgi:hypothetical protein
LRSGRQCSIEKWNYFERAGTPITGKKVVGLTLALLTYDTTGKIQLTMWATRVNGAKAAAIAPANHGGATADGNSQPRYNGVEKKQYTAASILRDKGSFINSSCSDIILGSYTCLWAL